VRATEQKFRDRKFTTAQTTVCKRVKGSSLLRKVHYGTNTTVCIFKTALKSRIILKNGPHSRMRNFHTFQTVYHLYHLDKRFKNYNKNSTGYEIKISRSEVHYRTPGSLQTCKRKFRFSVFLGGNPTHRNRWYEFHLSKSTVATCDWQWYDSNLTLPCRLVQSEHRKSANFKSIHMTSHLSVFVFLKLIKNRNEFGKYFYMKKLRLVNIFPTPYHLLHFDKRFEINWQNSVRRI